MDTPTLQQEAGTRSPWKHGVLAGYPMREPGLATQPLCRKGLRVPLDGNAMNSAQGHPGTRGRGGGVSVVVTVSDLNLNKWNSTPWKYLYLVCDSSGPFSKVH